MTKTKTTATAAVAGDVIDGETGEVLHEAASNNGSTSTAVATITKPARLLRPIAPPAEMMAVQNEMRAMLTASLKEGRDFGRVPGIDKPFLFKAGAERIALAMGCYYGEPRVVEREVDHDRVVKWQKRKKVWKNRYQGDREFDWEVETGESLGLYRYVLAVPVIDRSTGNVVGEGIGSCSTMESKYIDRPRDSENTVIKMAHKRALVAAGLLAFGLSDEYTQDEDVVEAVTSGGNGNGGTKASGRVSEPEAECPKCKGRMWDNRADNDKREAKGEKLRPDFKCRDKDCDGVYWRGQWPPKESSDKEDDSTSGNSKSATSGSASTRPATAAETSPNGPTTTTKGPRFPKWAQFAEYEGQSISEMPSDVLRQAAELARARDNKTAQRLADAIDLELDSRNAGAPAPRQDARDLDREGPRPVDRRGYNLENDPDDSDLPS